MRHQPGYFTPQLRAEVRSFNAHTRARRVVLVVGQCAFAVALGVALALLLAGWLTPCEAGSLCMAAVITPTRVGWRQWLHRQRQALRARYLRTRINAAELDLLHLQYEAESIPLQMTVHKHAIDAWRVQLIDCELSSRNR